MRTKKTSEPVRCSRCSKIGPPGKYCSHCGADMRGQPKTRMVVQSSGELKPMVGDIYSPRRIDERPESEKIWERTFFRCRNAGFTFRQAEALFAHENYGAYPNRAWKLMPKNEVDFYRKCADVPRSDLT